MNSPPTSPAAAAGESGMTSASRTFQMGWATNAMSVKMSQASTKLTTTPANEDAQARAQRLVDEGARVERLDDSAALER